MIIKYKPIILSIELLSNIILISLNKNTNIYYKEIIKENNIENLLNLINNILNKNYLILKYIDLIILNFGMSNYTNSKILSAIVQSISLSMKIPTKKISTSYVLAINLSKTEKNKYLIITEENNNNIFEIYINNNKNLKLISNEIIYKKNYTILNNNVTKIKKSLNLYKNNKLTPSIYTYVFIKNKNLFNKFDLPNKIIPHFKNKNVYSYYSE